MNNAPFKIKELATELWKTPECERHTFIRELLIDYRIKFIEHKFKEGINFIIGNALKSKSIISSHYDGLGMYDNAVGCILLIYLKLKEINNDVCYVLFDQEEKGCLGAKSFFKLYNSFDIHYDIGGCGIGDNVFFKNPKTPFVFKYNNKSYSLPFLCDATMSSTYIKCSWHIFFLNNEDANLIGQGYCPSSFFMLHDERDNEVNINNNSINNNISHLKNIFFNKSNSVNNSHINTLS